VAIRNLATAARLKETQRSRAGLTSAAPLALFNRCTGMAVAERV